MATAQYLDLTGNTLPEGEQLTGRRLLVENYDPIGAIGYWRRGELGLRSWLASMRAVDERAWFARDDLRPFGLMCLRMAGRLASRSIGSRHRPGQRGESRHRRPEFRYAAGRAASRPAA